MTNQEKTDLALQLAAAWLKNGHEDMARAIITKLINDGLNESL